MKNVKFKRWVMANRYRHALVAGAWLIAVNAASAQDIGAGQTAFVQCAACHSIDGSNGAGPSLQGIAGRKAGSFPGFEYSRAMKANNTVWDAATLGAYLSDPHGLVPGNLMPFAGLLDATQRANLVAYLLTLPPRRLASVTATHAAATSYAQHAPLH